GVLASSSDVTIADTLFEGNAASVTGGGLYLSNHYFNGQGSSLARSTFRNNRSVTGGGATLNGLLRAPIEDCVFSGNATEASGGGLEVMGASSSATLRRCSITGNTAGTQGGGIAGGALTIVDSDLSGNAALYFGGAVFCGNLDITNSTITKNLVTFTSQWQGFIYGGAGIYSRNGAVRITNCTLADNTSNYNSGGFYGEGASLALVNSVLWNPGAPEEITIERAPSLSVTYSDVRGGYPGTGNINADPLFVRPALGDYRLRDQSPCIDKGTNNGAPATDKNGAVRPQDGNNDGIAVCDQGAFEGGVYTNVAPIANAGADQTLHAGETASLSGAASVDPDENYPLAYQWTLLAGPAGSGAALSDPTAPAAAFVADLPGDYVVELIVTDSLGLRSLPDQVLVSTSNTPPVADAGGDQPVIERGTLIRLAGDRSYDLDGDPISYEWSFLSVPEGSAAVLAGRTAVQPTFIADVNGTYVVQLKVSDAWSTSDPDTVTVSFTNLPPVADPGSNLSVLQGETVALDGSGSSDPNLDPLTFRWTFVTVPAGSEAQLSDSGAVQPSFTADLPGLYIVSLVVGDGLAESEARAVQVYAVSYRDALIDKLQGLIATVNGIPDDLFKNPNMKHALSNKLTEVIRMAERGQYAEAMSKLENDVRAKTDGCAAAGEPDANDWIRDCGAQAQVCPLIDEILGLLAQLAG
ncbi:MAG TPA: PKD domain-containing protein, partial [Candidatus Methanoperedens sp.]|nr:PKD domain-containing protein [Candidatus Methanoperedens sp.]